MIKKYINIFLILSLVLFIFLNYKDKFQQTLLSITDKVNNTYTNIYFGTVEFIETYFNQAKTIASLKQENQKLQELATLSNTFANQLNNLIANYNPSLAKDPRLKIVQTVSYAKMGDYNKVWIHYDEFNSSKRYGLIKNSFASGIVVSKNDRPLALLNGDEKCSYSVTIGEKKAPGITKGYIEDNIMLVDFIPSWIDINIGDEVITSGLDEIFFSGVRVGNVLEIRNSQGYKQALIKPYANTLENSYYFIIDKLQ
ncbi:MAG: rod shape-determining protein MreC [Campylobacterales bacterium]|nr:rod shape-determining protein MreC [Campylobacterales bacterium]